MSNSEKKNKICKLNIEKAPNNLQRFRVSINPTPEAGKDWVDHRNDFDKGGKRIVIWHHIVNGVLVARHISYDLSEWSPYFFMEKQAKMSCIIGRVFRTNFDPNTPNDHLNVGMESQNRDEELHICVSLDKKEVIVIKPDPLNPGNIVKLPDFTIATEQMYLSDPMPWNSEAFFRIHGEAEGDEIRFSYPIMNSTEEGVPFVPVWYFYLNGPENDPIVSLETSPIISWKKLRDYYEANKASLPQGKDLWTALKEKKCYVMLRFHRSVSLPGNPTTRESDVGQSNPGGPPSGGN